MTNREILEYRFVQRFMPGLFAFAYPVSGRGVPWARRLALRAWCRLLGLAVSLRDS